MEKKKFGTHQCHTTGGFRKPLIPAYTDANFSETGVPDLKTRIAVIKIELFLIAGPVGDMRLAVNPQDTAVSVDHSDAVVACLVFLLKKADRQNDRAVFDKHLIIRAFYVMLN